jgi:hypothetical protein
MFKSSLNQAYFEHPKESSYSHQKDLSNNVSNAPVGNHLTPVLKVIVVKS